LFIHVTEGTYTSAINWFRNDASNVSAHYVIRSSDGQITQMVREKDIAWHAGYWDWNVKSIGIEHEAYVNNPAWYTDAMYRSSAALTRNIAIIIQHSDGSAAYYWSL
jgi:N-acetyl-anhydromuramyl-L-alanine amidase AmpD